MTNTHKQQRFGQDNHDHRNEAFHHGENNHNSEDLESLTMSEVKNQNTFFYVGIIIINVHTNVIADFG